MSPGAPRRPGLAGALQALHILCGWARPRLRRTSPRARTRARGAGPSRRRALHEIVFGTSAGVATWTGDHPASQPAARPRSIPGCGRSCGLHRLPADLLDRVPRWAAVDEAVSVARLKSRVAGARRVRQRGAASLTRAPGRRARPRSRSRRRRALVLSGLDGRALDLALRNGGSGAPHGALDERPPVTHPGEHLRITRETWRPPPRRGAGRDRSPPRWAPEGLTVRRGAVGRWAAFTAGWCTIQDEASMLVARLLDPQPASWSPDTCAAPGHQDHPPGPAHANRGRIVAMDPNAARLRLLTQAAARLGVEIVEAHAGGVATVSGRWKAGATGCSWTPVLEPRRAAAATRREVEPRGGGPRAWPRSSEASCRRKATLARPGGRLVYATCSLEAGRERPDRAGIPRWPPGLAAGPTGGLPGGPRSRRIHPLPAPGPRNRRVHRDPPGPRGPVLDRTAGPGPLRAPRFRVRSHP